MLFRGCQGCLLFDICGGTKAPLLGDGACYSQVQESRYEDEMKPSSHLFWRYWDDVGGLAKWDFETFVTPTNISFPGYIPMVRNGCRRITLLDQKVVAIPLFKVIGKRKGGRYGSRFTNGDELRRHFKVRPDAQVILVGVSEDPSLEHFWQEHLASGVLEELSELSIDAITAPNFSTFEDMSQFDIFRNIKRSLLISERLSKLNVPVVPHLNAMESSHWNLWGNFLKNHPEVEIVCKEFQTGMKDPGRGIDALDNLSWLQDMAGRRLHPILVGGGSFYSEAAKRFDSFSIVDSRPHMLAMARIQLTAISARRFQETVVRVPVGQPVDPIYRQNIKVHSDNIRFGRLNNVSKNDSCQLELEFPVSTPYLIAQPAA